MVISRRNEPEGDFRKKNTHFFLWVEVSVILYLSKAETLAHILVGMTTSLDPYGAFWSLMKSKSHPKSAYIEVSEIPKISGKKILFFYFKNKCLVTHPDILEVHENHPPPSREAI